MKISFSDDTKQLINTFCLTTSDIPSSNQIEKVKKQLTHLIQQPTTIQAVDKLVKKLNKTIEKNPKSPLATQLLAIKKALEANLQKGESAAPFYPTLDICLLSDFMRLDYNGTLTPLLQSCLEQKIPFIASRALLSGAGQEFAKVTHAISTLHSQLLHQYENSITIFTSTNLDNQLLLILPKNYQEIPEQEILECLGFDSEKLRKISLKEALQGTSLRPMVEHFYELFSPVPKGNKHFYLAGHGSSQRTAGIHLKDYPQFLQFLQSQLTKSLYVDSCRAGGWYSQYYLPDEENEEHPLGFSIIPRSIGDFEIGQELILNLLSYFQAIHTITDETPGREVTSLKKASQILEDALRIHSSHLSDVLKILSPSSKKKGQQFRLLIGPSSFYELTYSRMQMHLIEKQTQLRNKSYLGIHPLHITVPFTFKPALPVILSMIPGASHHFFEEITLLKRQLVHWIESHDSTIYRAERYDSDHVKGLFFRQITDESSRYENVFISFHKKRTIAGYLKEKIPYVLWEENRLNEGVWEGHMVPHACSIPLFVAEYYFSFKEATPIPKAVKAASQGKETDIGLQQHVFSDSCWRTIGGLPKFMRPFVDTANKGVLRPADFEKLASLTKDEKTALLLLALYEGADSLAIELLENGEIDPDAAFFGGDSLLNLAIKRGSLPMVNILLEKGANVNFKHAQTGMTPLLTACAQGYASFVALLLEQPKIDTSATDVNGKNLFFYCMSQDELMTLATTSPHIRQDEIDQTSHEGITCLGQAVRLHDLATAKRLRAAGADLNIGGPSPLSIAFYENDAEMVRWLCEEEADLNAADENGQLPLVLAARCASPELLAWVLEREGLELGQRDSWDRSPLLAACESGNFQKIQLLLDHGAAYDAEELLNYAEEAQNTELLEFLKARIE